MWDTEAWDLIETLPAEDESEARSESPDGKWVVVEVHRWNIRYGDLPYNYHEMRLESLTGDTELVLDRRVDLAGGLGSRYTKFIMWSAKGRGMYYADWFMVDGGGLFPFYSSFENYNPETKEYKNLTVGLSGDIGLSPDEDTVVYFGGAGRETVYLFIRSLVDDSLSAGLLEPQCLEQGGGFVWSPNQTKVAFTIYHGTCGDFEEGSVVLILDLQTKNIRIIHDGNDFDLVALEWNENGIEVDFLDDDRPNGYLDPSTGELVFP